MMLPLLFTLATVPPEVPPAPKPLPREPETAPPALLTKLRQVDPMANPLPLLSDTAPQDTSTPTDTPRVRTVKVGPKEYVPAGDDCPNRVAIRAMTKRKGGFKRDKPFKGARVV